MSPMSKAVHNFWIQYLPVHPVNVQPFLTPTTSASFLDIMPKLITWYTLKWAKQNIILLAPIYYFAPTTLGLQMSHLYL